MTRELTPAKALAAAMAYHGDRVIDWAGQPTDDHEDLWSALELEATGAGRSAAMKHLAGLGDGEPLDLGGLAAEGFLWGFLVGATAAEQQGPAWVAWMRECPAWPLVNLGVAETGAQRIVGGAQAMARRLHEAEGHRG